MFYKKKENIGDSLIVICKYDLYTIILGTLAKKQNLKGFEVFKNSLLVNDIIKQVEEEKLNIPFLGFESFIEEAVKKFIGEK
jgi:hypothetical protein